MSLECIPEVASAANVPPDVVGRCLQALNSAPVKDALKRNTDEAIGLGTTGSPTIVATINGKREMYFGQDRLLILAHEAGKPWLGPHPQPVSKV